MPAKQRSFSSRVQFLDVQALLLDARGGYLSELKAYLANRVALESQFNPNAG